MFLLKFFSLNITEKLSSTVCNSWGLRQFSLINSVNYLTSYVLLLALITVVSTY